ncbi:MAG: serine/threonine-protein kinase [Pirellulaceae bacterium]|nr:serine/threonine-protein kinase [Pirellulaceae bacterium]
MHCLDLQSVKDLLRGDRCFEPEVIEHLRTCAECQQRFDRAADDPELRHWRNARDKTQREVRPSPACLDMLERFRTGETSSEKASTHATATDPRSVPPTPILEAGSLIDRFRIVRELGRGGMSIVLEAVDTRIHRTVALKLMQTSTHYDRAHARFMREAKAIASIHHPNVITVFEAGYPDNALPYLVMELVEGETLRSWITKGEGFNLQLSAQIIAQIADGLEAAHQAGVLHRDIKPSNILLARLNAAGANAVGSIPVQPKLADFGLARPLTTETDLTQSGFIAGTPAYASPEQVRTPEMVDQRSDVYSLGVTLYESLTGTVPFRGSAQAVLQQIVEGELIPPKRLNPSISIDLETICLKAMSRDAGQRYASAAEFAADLRRWLSGEPILARRSSSFEKLWRWVVRNPRVAALTTSTAGLLLTLAGGALMAALVINAKNDQLESEIEKSRLAGLRSERFAKSATEQRELAIASLNDLINKVQTQLKDQPGTLKLREELLRTAFAGLERVAKSADQTGLEHTTIEAHQQMSKILTALGDAPGAMSQVRTATELCYRAIAANPESAELKLDLANSLAIEANLHREAFAFDKIQPVLERLLELRQSIAASQKEDFGAQRNLLVCKQQLADVALRRFEYINALEGFKSVLTSIVQLQAQFPDQQELLRDQYILQNRMASVLLQLNRMQEAETLLNNSVQQSMNLLTKDPNNTTHQTDLGSVLSRLARLKLATHEHAAALEFALRSKSQYDAVSSENPADATLRSFVGNVTYLLYEVHFAMGQYDDARIAAEASAQIQIQLNEQHPGSTKPLYLAEEAISAAGGIYMRQGDLAKALQAKERSCELLHLATQAQDYSPNGPYAKNLERSKAIARAFSLCIAGEKAIEDAMVVDPYNAQLALALHVYELARRGEFETMTNRADLLRDLSQIPESDQDLLLFPIARAFGIAASKLIPVNASPSDESRLQTMQDNCIESLTRLLKISPQYRELLRSEPDLACFRENAAFIELLTAQK